MPKSAAMQENSQSNSAELLVFPGCEPPARPSSADPEPERNVREQLAGGQQDLRIELNALGNAAHVAVQMPPLSGPSVAHIHKQLCSVLAAVICCVVRLTAFVLSLGYFVGRQSVHSSNAVGVTCQCANASATLELLKLNAALASKNPIHTYYYYPIKPTSHEKNEHQASRETRTAEALYPGHEGKITHWRSEESPTTTVTDGKLTIPFNDKLMVSAQITLDELEQNTSVSFWFELIKRKPFPRSHARRSHADQLNRKTIGIYQFVSGTSTKQTFSLSPCPPALVEAGDLLEVHFEVSDPQGVTVWIKTTALVLWNFPT